MLIRCTKKLLSELKVEPESVAEENPLFSWHANIITLNRRKTVVLVNDSNRYAVVLYGLKAKDFKKFNEIAQEGIRATFEEEGIKEEVINQYFHESEGVTYTKTKDRTSVARMNKACENAYFLDDLLAIDSLFQPVMGNRISRFLVGDGKNSYILPNEKLYDDLELLVGQPVFESTAAILKVTLQLEERQVWRRLIVPLHKTFIELHRILQEAFTWQDYHLHAFMIDDASNAGKVAITDEESVELSEYLSTDRKLVYLYDFGDDWHHDIEVESIIDDYDANHSVCLEGEGNAPPEDVGGPSGYERFLNILANPSHPEYEHLVQWGQMQRYQDFDIKFINYELKGI